MGTGETGTYYTSHGSDRVHHGAMIHSIEGKYSHDQKTGHPKNLKSGGHMQASMDLMDKYGIEYHVVKTFWNGVRVGYVPGHGQNWKRSGTGQTWFPKSWTAKDVVKAGEHVSKLPSNRHVKDGVTIWGTYKQVKVGVIKTNGQVATVFPAENQPKRKGRRRK